MQSWIDGWNRLIVLANRAPFMHERARDGRIHVKRAVSGLVTALEPLIEKHSGVWVAHGAGTADDVAVDYRDGLDVPPAKPRYRLRYVWLDEREHRGYYYGFANEGLWPLCHKVPVPPVFRVDDYRMYRAANERFAAAVAEEAAGSQPLVLVQDYHFALAPRLIRQRLTGSRIVAFWHVPWPRPHVFRTCPQAETLLDGLLASDVVGLQTPDDCANFLGSVEALLDARVDRLGRRITYRGHVTLVRPYPVGVETGNEEVRTAPAPHICREQWCHQLQISPDVRLGVGIDRLDYTKGINEKFLAVERLLELSPELRGRFVFAQVAAPSRDCLPAYRAARAEIIETAARVNARFGTTHFAPIRVIETHHEPASVYRLYRAADFCFVGSLHDGMNLVAKEFVAARDDERGVLVLSEFAGAAQQLRAALLVNPHAIGKTAEALAQALTMSSAEQTKRMRLLRANVAAFDAAWWARQLLRDVAVPLRLPDPRQEVPSHLPLVGAVAIAERRQQRAFLPGNRHDQIAGADNGE